MPRKPAVKPATPKPVRKRKPRAKKAATRKAPPERSSRSKRLEHKRKAAEAIERHSGPVLGMLAEVVHEMSDEVEGLSRAEQDLAHCMELSHRLDKAIKLSDPIAEALDGLVIFFVAAAAVGIYRAIEHGEKVKSRRLSRLKEKLQLRGESMAPHVRRMLERRISRLEG